MKHNHLSPAAWAAIVEAYELGLANIRELAVLHSVSRQAIWNGLTKRGAVKGRRVAEAIDPLVQQLDEELVARRREREEQRQRKWEQVERSTKELGRMVAALVKADAAGASLTRWEEFL